MSDTELKNIIRRAMRFYCPPHESGLVDSIVAELRAEYDWVSAPAMRKTIERLNTFADEQQTTIENLKQSREFYRREKERIERDRDALLLESKSDTFSEGSR